MRFERRQHDDAAARDALIGPAPEPVLVSRHERVDEDRRVAALAKDRADMLVPVVRAVGLGARFPSGVRRAPAPQARGDLVDGLPTRVWQDVPSTENGAAEVPLR